MRKINRGKWLCTGLAVVMLLFVGVEGRAEEAGNPGGSSGWTRVETTSRGNFKVGDGDAVYIRSADITNLAAGLNLLGTEFKAGSQEVSAVKTELKEEAAARTQGDRSLREGLDGEASARQTKDAELLQTIQDGLAGLQASFQDGVGKICAKLAELGCTPEEYKPSETPPAYPSPEAICEKLGELYQTGYQTGYDEGVEAGKPKSQTVVLTDLVMSRDNTTYFQGFYVMTFDQLEKVGAFRVDDDADVGQSFYRIDGNKIHITAWNGSLPYIGDYVITAYEVD